MYPTADIVAQIITSAIIDTSNVLLGFDFQKASAFPCNQYANLQL